MMTGKGYSYLKGAGLFMIPLLHFSRERLIDTTKKACLMAHDKDKKPKTTIWRRKTGFFTGEL